MKNSESHKLQDQYFKFISLFCFFFAPYEESLTTRKNWELEESHLNVDNFDLWLIKQDHMHFIITKQKDNTRTLWIQDKVKSQLIETLQLPVSHFFCLHLNQGKVIHVLYTFCNIKTRICVLFMSMWSVLEMYHRKQWLIWFNIMCLWNPDMYLEDILCWFLDQKKYIFYGLVELIKKWAEKRKENNCGFMLQADFRLF